MYSIENFNAYKMGDRLDKPVLVWTIKDGYFFLPYAVENVTIIGVINK